MLGVFMSFRPLAAALAVAMLLTACGAKSPAPPTQVAAKVGKGEISTSQVNFLLHRQGEIPPQLQPKAQREILERLVDQELAVQKAQALKIDREPLVMQAVEAAKRDILARAYMERATVAVPKPTPEELKEYYASHPALFSQRRIYEIQELNVLATTEQLSKVQAKLNAAKSSDEVLAALKNAGLSPEVRHSALTPENIPQSLIERITTLQLGQPLLLNATGGLKAIFVTSTKPAAIDEATALPRIETFLMTDRKNKAAEQELKTLRTSQPVEYMGQFAASAASAVSAASGASGAPASSPAKASHAASTPSNKMDDATVNRGLQ
jgi:EpsD family peptidyl-prolyl cis-trans isomerase